jgi:hypothetical protein
MGNHAENHLQSAGFARTPASRQSTVSGVPIHHHRSAGWPGQALPHLQQDDRSYPGFNLFDSDDDTLFRAIVRGEFNISGLQNKTLRRHLQEKNSGQVSRLLKRLRVHGLIKKAGRTYKYYLTQFGKDVIATGLKLRELVIIPQLAFGHLA